MYRILCTCVEYENMKHYINTFYLAVTVSSQLAEGRLLYTLTFQYYPYKDVVFAFYYSDY